MFGWKQNCKFCERTVAKSAYALKCLYCKVWVHIGCGALVEEDFVFMENKSNHGFHWYWDAWQGGPDAAGAAQSLASIKNRLAERVISLVS